MNDQFIIIDIVKILLLVHAFLPESSAGTEVLTYNLAKKLTENGHKVIVLAGDLKTEKLAIKQEIVRRDFEDIEVYMLHYNQASINNRIRRHFSDNAINNIIKEFVSSIQPDVVSFNHIIGFTAEAIKTVKRLNIPTMYLVTDFWSVCPKIKLFKEKQNKVCNGPDRYGANCMNCLLGTPTFFNKILLWMSSRKIFRDLTYQPIKFLNNIYERKSKMLKNINFADKIIVPTSLMYRTLLENGVDSSKMEKISFGLDIIFDKKGVFKKESDRLVFGFIGSLIPSKGPEILINSFNFLNKIKGNKSKLMIYGKEEHTRYYKKLKNISKKNDNAIEFRGTFNSKDIGVVLEGIDVLIIPSLWYENMPLVLCSALITKTPVIVSNFEGMTEFVHEGVEGYFFEPGNHEDLASKMELFLLDKNLHVKLSKAMVGNLKNLSSYTLQIENKLSEISKQDYE